MKTTKKVFAVLIAFVLMLSMAIPASAADNSITVTNAEVGETYSLYKMADLTTDGDTFYSYTVLPAWEAFFAQDYVKDYYDVAENKTLTAKNGLADNSEAMEKIGKLAIAYAAENNIPTVGDPCEATGSTVEFANLDNGYYLISSTLGTLAIVESTPSKQTEEIVEKNKGPELEKEIVEGENLVKENDVNVGDTVNFQVTITAKRGAKNYVMHDKMEKGLAFNGSVVIKQGDKTLIENTDYELITNPDVVAGMCDEKGCDFHIVFTQAYLDTITAVTEIVVTYSAVLTADAIDDLDGVKNDAKLSYGDKSSTEWDETNTKTYQIGLLKYNGNDAEKNPLAGATFQLKNADGDVLKLVKIDDNNYRLATADDTDVVESFVTTASKGGEDGTDGHIYIKGLDAGTYTFTETEAPAGFNILQADNEVTAGADDNIATIEVANFTGTELPNTGGMGTTILYVVGGALVVGAVVVLIVKRRMSSVEEA